MEKVYDIVGLYLNPPEAAVVYCVDEKSQVQALARSQPALPMMPGMPEKRTHDYLRHGTTSLFAAFNTADGTVISSVHRRHRTIEFKKFLAKIDAEVPTTSTCISCVTTTERTRPPRSRAGLRATPASTSTTRRRTPAGSTRSSGGSHTSPRISYSDPITAASKRSSATSAAGSRRGMRTPSRSSGPRRPSRFSNQSHDF